MPPAKTQQLQTTTHNPPAGGAKPASGIPASGIPARGERFHPAEQLVMTHMAARRNATRPAMEPAHALDLAAEEIDHIAREYTDTPAADIAKTCAHGLATVHRLLDDPEVVRALDELPDDRHVRYCLAVAATGNRPASYLHAGFPKPQHRPDFLEQLQALDTNPAVIRAIAAITEAWNRRWAQSADTIADSVQLAMDLALGRRPSKRTVVSKGEVTVVEEFFQSDPRSAAKLAEVQLRLLGLQEEATRTATNAVSWEVPRTPAAQLDHDVHDAASTLQSMDAADERAKKAKRDAKANNNHNDGLVDLASLRGKPDLE